MTGTTQSSCLILYPKRLRVHTKIKSNLIISSKNIENSSWKRFSFENNLNMNLQEPYLLVNEDIKIGILLVELA